MRGWRGVRTVAGASLVATALIMSLTGCGPLLVLANETAAQPTPNSITSPQPTPIQHYSDGSTSVRGNIPKVVGEKAGMLTDDGQTRLVTFTVTRILPNPRCQNSDSSEPANGNYLEVDLHVITTDALGTQDGDQTVTFLPDTWFYYPGGGNVGIGASVATDDCQLATAPLPATIGPGEDVSGSVLLDVNADSRYLAYAPHYADGCGCSAWEWPYVVPAG